MKLFNYLHIVGLLLVLATAFLILVLLQHSFLAHIIFSIGVVFLTLGRFFGPSSDYTLSRDRSSSFISRRLHRQRLVAVCILYLSILLLFLPEGFYFGYYIRKSLWFIPFMIFTIIEVYTTFRLSSIEKNDNTFK